MKPTLIINIQSLYGEVTLAGATSGQAFLPKLIEATKGTPRDAVLALDFSKVDIVTASFFRSAFRAFRDYARSTALVYPVLANVNAATREEITFFAEGSGDVFLIATLGKSGELSAPRVLGRLDPKQAHTLNAVVQLGEADAGQLRGAYPEQPPVSSAAWSNRLAVLAARGFILETLVGRSKRFRPILKGLSYGP